MSQVVVTARIDAETASKLDRLGEFYDRKRGWLIARAIKQYAEECSAFVDFVEEGLVSGESEGWIPHEDIVAEFAPHRLPQKSAA